MMLVDVARQCREVYDTAAKDLGNDLGGHSVLDFCADNIDASLTDLKAAIIVAGIYNDVSDRLKREIASYR